MTDQATPEATLPADSDAVVAPVERRVRRLQSKLDKRDQKIAGLQRRVRELELTLARQYVERDTSMRDIRRAVQEALCNVRMIPVLGIGKNARIVEVKSSDA